jgi:hypothetical protein
MHKLKKKIIFDYPDSFFLIFYSLFQIRIILC